MSRKTGLILCRNLTIPVPRFYPKTLAGFDASSKASNNKFDYVANLDCYNDVVEGLWQPDHSFKSLRGLYIHVEAVKNALEALGIQNELLSPIGCKH